MRLLRERLLDFALRRHVDVSLLFLFRCLRDRKGAEDKALAGISHNQSLVGILKSPHSNMFVAGFGEYI